MWHTTWNQSDCLMRIMNMHCIRNIHVHESVSLTMLEISIIDPLKQCVT